MTSAGTYALSCRSLGLFNLFSFVNNTGALLLFFNLPEEIRCQYREIPSAPSPWHCDGVIWMHTATPITQFTFVSLKKPGLSGLPHWNSVVPKTPPGRSL